MIGDATSKRFEIHIAGCQAGEQRLLLGHELAVQGLAERGDATAQRRVRGPQREHRLDLLLHVAKTGLDALDARAGRECEPSRRKHASAAYKLMSRQVSTRAALLGGAPPDAASASSARRSLPCAAARIAIAS